MQQPVVEPCPFDLDPFRQHKGALKLARGDAAMQIDPLPVVGLLAAYDEWLSSRVMLRSCIVKPATASVIRNAFSPSCSML